MNTLRDLYPPLAGSDDGDGGLVPNAAVPQAIDDGAAIDVQLLAEEVRQSSAFLDEVFHQVARVVVGQRDMVERVLIGLLTGGHCLIEGVPGLAKTLMVKTLAQTINATFQRIQFTPDLLPADITGTIIYNMHTGEFTQKRGPLFANLVLADEVNRAPAKVQSALLEAMQERQVTIGDTSHPLPEAQLDRFMFKVLLDYPSKEDELAILERMSGIAPDLNVEPVLGPPELEPLRFALDSIYVDLRIKRYIVDIVHSTRRPAESGLDLAPFIQYGASPRATIFLTRAARGQAFLDGRGYVTPQDVKTIAFDVLRHRVSVTYEAEAEEITPEKILQRIFEHLAVP